MGVLLDHGLLLLDHLLQLLFAQLTQKLFVEDGHYPVLLPLRQQLLEEGLLLVVLRQVRNGVEVTLAPGRSFSRRLLAGQARGLGRCGLLGDDLGGVAVAPACSVGLRGDKHLVALGGLSRFRGLRPLDRLLPLCSRWTGRPPSCWLRCLH